MLLREGGSTWDAGRPARVPVTRRAVLGSVRFLPWRTAAGQGCRFRSARTAARFDAENAFLPGPLN